MIKKQELTDNELSIFLALSSAEQELFLYEIPELLKQHDTTIIAHYYTPAIIQLLAEKTSGIVADSLAMAKFGEQASAKNLLIAGVYFMAETAKILSPNKSVKIVSVDATCSLDISCPYDQFKEYIKANEGCEVVVYANTSAKVRTLADWVVTSSNAIDIIKYLTSRGKKIIWAPDKHLGNYIKRVTNANMLIWEGECVVHAEFTASKLKEMCSIYPEARVLAHPESPESVLELSDVIGSTSQLINVVKKYKGSKFIVATDSGIFYKMQQTAPENTYIIAPTLSEGGSCRACAKCPWMGMNTLSKIKEALINSDNDINLPTDVIDSAQTGMQRMINFSRELV